MWVAKLSSWISMRTLSDLKQLYEIDEARWLEETIELLKERQWEAIDLENLVEELEDLGREKKNAVVSLLEQSIRHFLLYQYRTTEREQNANHWEAEIYSFKLHLNRLSTRNLEIYLEKNLDNIYRSSQIYVQKKTKLQTLPDENPYLLTDVLSEAYLPHVDREK
jgi:hypothetical protein